MYGWSLPAGRKSSTRRALAAACALAVGVTGWLTAVPGTDHAAATPASTVAGGDSPSKQAKASGERVEVLDKRTETAQTFANPDGTFTLEQ